MIPDCQKFSYQKNSDVKSRLVYRLSQTFSGLSQDSGGYMKAKSYYPDAIFRPHLAATHPVIARAIVERSECH
jgi:hypothetical protein